MKTLAYFAGDAISRLLRFERLSWLYRPYSWLMLYALDRSGE